MNYWVRINITLSVFQCRLFAFHFCLVKKSLLSGLKKSMNSLTNNHFPLSIGKSICRKFPHPPSNVFKILILLKIFVFCLVCVFYCSAFDFTSSVSFTAVTLFLPRLCLLLQCLWFYLICFFYCSVFDYYVFYNCVFYYCIFNYFIFYLCLFHYCIF